MAQEEAALTMKEAVMEVRRDVKEIKDGLATKANDSEFQRLLARVEALEQRVAVNQGVADFKKWIVGLGVTAILSLLGLIGSIVLRLIPLHKP